MPRWLRTSAILFMTLATLIAGSVNAFDSDPSQAELPEQCDQDGDDDVWELAPWQLVTLDVRGSKPWRHLGLPAPRGLTSSPDPRPPKRA